MSRTILLVCILAASVACSSRGTVREASPVVLPEAGVVHDHIAGFTSKDISYALYLPAMLKSRGDAGIRFPVIVLFDPHGSGSLPVGKYHELADKYRMILIGSNNSRNGLQGPEIRGILSAMSSEVRSVYPVDSSRICFAGFSGGARVAAIGAMENSRVKGVIGCGAGFPGGIRPDQARKFDYFGIAGTADFNMNEVLEIDEPMTAAGIRHCITTFPGPHDWPPAPVMERAFQWLTLNAMRDGGLKKDDAVITGIMAGFRERISSERQANHLISAADACREAIRFGDGLARTDEFASQLENITDLPAYKKQVEYHQAVVKKEMEQQTLFQNSLMTKDIGWWKERLAQMDTRNMKGSNPEDTLMNARLKAFLGLFCYSASNSFLVNRQYAEAERAISVYRITEPKNPEPDYMSAIVMAAGPDSKRAIEELKVAVSKGFNDKDRMTRQFEFEPLQQSPEWFDLMKSIK